MAKPDNETGHSVGAAYHTESRGLFGKSLLFGTVLILAHLLDIRPSSIEAAGLEIAVADPGILYGGIALVYLYHLFRAIEVSEVAVALLPLTIQKAKIRNSIRGSRLSNKGKPIAYVKKQARLGLKIINVLLAPYYIAIAVITILAFIFSVSDIYFLVDYIIRNSELIAYAWENY